LLLLSRFSGYRLVAQSLLPIKSDSLIYGSKDGGVTIDTGDKHPQFKPLIQDIASKENTHKKTQNTFPENTNNNEIHNFIIFFLFSLSSTTNETDFLFSSFFSFFI
jgi:hypothetical protein